MSGELGVDEAARRLGLSERSVRRQRAVMEREGPTGVVHGNRGRASPRRLAEATRTRILGLADGAYAGFDDTHLAEVLAEREGITISRPGLRRLLRSTGRKAKRRRRAPRQRSRRDCMEREGLLLQTDGSRHDWLGDRGPRLTLVGYIDDASGRVTPPARRQPDRVERGGRMAHDPGPARRGPGAGARWRSRGGRHETGQCDHGCGLPAGPPVAPGQARVQAPCHDREGGTEAVRSTEQSAVKLTDLRHRG